MVHHHLYFSVGCLRCVKHMLHGTRQDTLSHTSSSIEHHSSTAKAQTRTHMMHHHLYHTFLLMAHGV